MTFQNVVLLHGLTLDLIPIAIFIGLIFVSLGSEHNERRRRNAFMLITLSALLVVGPVLFFWISDPGPEWDFLIAIPLLATLFGWLFLLFQSWYSPQRRKMTTIFFATSVLLLATNLVPDHFQVSLHGQPTPAPGCHKARHLIGPTWIRAYPLRVSGCGKIVFPPPEDL